MSEDRWGKYRSIFDCCGRWDSCSTSCCKQPWEAVVPWSYRLLRARQSETTLQKGPEFIWIETIFKLILFIDLFIYFPRDFPHSFTDACAITRITTNINHMILCKEMWGFIQTWASRLAQLSPKMVTLSSVLQKKWQRRWKIQELADK